MANRIELIARGLALPAYMPATTRNLLATNGVGFGNLVEDDARLIRVQLPSGWRVGSEGQGPAHLLDDRGRSRAYIVHNDAASITNMLCRFAVLPREPWTPSGRFDVLDRSTGVVVFTAKIRRGDLPSWYDYYRQAAWEQAEAWLDERYPQWRDPAPYWD